MARAEMKEERAQEIVNELTIAAGTQERFV